MKLSTRALASAAIVSTLLFTAACSQSSSAEEQDPNAPLSFAMPPGTDDPDTLSQMGNVADHLAEATGREVELENPADYMAVVEAVRSGFVDVALMSQFSTALSYGNGSVIPLLTWEGELEPASLCIVMNDSDIEEMEDFRGGTIAFVDPGSTTGHFLPKSLLKKHDMTDGEDYESVFAGGHDSAVLAMIEGSVDMACTARMVLPMFIEAGMIGEDDFRIVGESDPIPIGISIVTHENLDDATRQQIIENLPELMLADDELQSLFGGTTGYYTEPELSVFDGLIQIAKDAGVDLEDMR